MCGKFKCGHVNCRYRSENSNRKKLFLTRTDVKQKPNKYVNFVHYIHFKHTIHTEVKQKVRLPTINEQNNIRSIS